MTSFEYGVLYMFSSRSSIISLGEQTSIASLDRRMTLTKAFSVGRCDRSHRWRPVWAVSRSREVAGRSRFVVGSCPCSKQAERIPSRCNRTRMVSGAYVFEVLKSLVFVAGWILVGAMLRNEDVSFTSRFEVRIVGVVSRNAGACSEKES